ncbi:MMPL family transporter [Ornithinimicrobium kibberense]|uniref:MMPL family transporter n=1 Tax=Ornithinimicrobium kibberense TaxID=282060 RepID=A0ABV5UY12_9MICO|nr:MMPL family transporter [Ornithinimicrobium kibberense]
MAGAHRPPRRPLLAALGRSTVRHRWWYLVTWSVLVVAAFVTALGLGPGPGLFDRLTSGAIEAPGDALVVQDVTSADADGPALIGSVTGADLQDPELVGAVAAFAEDAGEVDGVAGVEAPVLHPRWPAAPEALVAVRDQDPAGGAFLLTVELEPEVTFPQARDVLVGLETAYAGSLAERTEAVDWGGVPLLVDDITDQIQVDLQRGEGIALPISLVIMVVVFGGVLAALMPILGAVASIGGGLAILLGFSYLIDLDATVVNIVTVMGLALCIDYGLLLVSRFREELDAVAPGVRHRDLSAEQVEAAVVGALTTAGRTVLFSGLIVGIALSGLVLFEAPIMRAIGAAGVAVVVVALLVALTLVPALAATWARRLGHRRGAGAVTDDGVFSRLAWAVQRRPVVTVVASTAVLLALAWPALGLRLTSSGTDLLPPGADQRVFFEQLEEDYPLVAAPDVVVLAQAPDDEVEAWAETAAAVDGVLSVDPPQDLGTWPEDVPLAAGADADAPLVRLGVRVEEGPLGEPAREVVDALRAAPPPADGEVWVGGQAASLADFVDSVWDRAGWAAGWIAGATVVLLFLLSGSVVIPLKAVVLNVISLGASLGLTVLVFQHGNLEGLLGFESVGALESVIPLLVLAFGFGLSMDYEVFLLSRVIELHEQGQDDDTAVRLGVQRSGRIITSAALIMIVVFAGFAAGHMLAIKQTGFALAAAVLVDATLVRMLLVPATMTLLGRWNWWAPGWLRRVHARVGVSERAPARGV